MEDQAGEELYDLQQDPDEVNNLAGSAKHHAQLAKMGKAHLARTMRIRDLGYLPEGGIHRRANDTTPYVRFVAAEAFVIHGANEETVHSAVDQLVDLADGQEHGTFLAVMALNMLEQADGKAQHQKAAIAKLPKNSINSPGRVGGYTTRLLQNTSSDLIQSSETGESPAADVDLVRQLHLYVCRQ